MNEKIVTPTGGSVTAPPITPKPGTKTVRVENANLQAMAAIDKVLAPLTPKARKAVIAWIVSEYAEEWIVCE